MTLSLLAARLLQPERTIPLADLPATWFQSAVHLRCPEAAALVGDPVLPGKIRGAFGEALKDTASTEVIAGRPCPWTPPSALDVLFRTQGKITPALEIPKPYVLALDAEDGDLLVQLTLFGFASDWTEMAAEALLRALRGPLSIGRSLEVGERRIWSEEGLAPFEASALSLQFETPLQIRQQGRTAVPDLPMLISNLGNRISGLARWQDATVEADWRALKAHAGEIALTAFDRESRDWQRFSRRQGRQIPMQGHMPAWLLQGDLAPILPLLQIGATTHAGSHASLGLGRFSLQLVE